MLRRTVTPAAMALADDWMKLTVVSAINATVAAILHKSEQTLEGSLLPSVNLCLHRTIALAHKE